MSDTEVAKVPQDQVNYSPTAHIATNLPKELMGFTGLGYEIKDRSYITSTEVLDYLKSFCDKFSLKNNIKFENLVTHVSRVDNGWNLTAKDLNFEKETTYFYDSIFICNGHFSEPLYPSIEGSDSFEGISLHSHNYKKPESFTNKRILIIGMGPSAQDITFNLVPVSPTIFLSHHGPDDVKTLFPKNVIHKPDVKVIKGRDIYFTDDTNVVADIIIYCTGYKYSFPFLDENCGISVDNNYVNPLYKQLFSIPHPTMIFIGLPYRSFPFPLSELQVKCAANILLGKNKLVSKKEMEEDMVAWEKLQASRGYSKNKYHIIRESVYEYFHEIAKIGGVTPCPDILFKIFFRSVNSRKIDLANYRNEVFKIIDSDSFIVIKENL